MRINRLLLVLLVTGLATTAGLTVSPRELAAQEAPRAALEYYLPPGVAYDPEIPTPASVLGYEPGAWHVSHDHIVEYFRALAASSDRMILEEIGDTHEGRTQLLAIISSPENLARIDAIRDRRQQITGSANDPAVTDDMPVVVWLGYSIHGNEPSGANASLVAAYHLAAGQGPEIADELDKAVILIDPALNPDGIQRFAGWVNSNRGNVLVSDPATREHNEPWPRGRTNHYLFDLNRDWMLLTHPESQNRVWVFQNWKPNIFADFHEMGTNATFFFQPGVPSRQNPLTPERNFHLTAEIAEYHAAALDAVGSLYYSRETFDDFYYGKGSTYPDIQGSIGILFEQASSRGHLQDSVNGTLAFPFTIRNQFLTSLSTIRAGVEKRRELLEYQRGFYREAREEADRDRVQGYVFGDDRDRGRSWALAEILIRHGIEVYDLERSGRYDGHDFPAEVSYVVPMRQPQYRLVKAMFEVRTEFPDSSFYDVSAWSLPLSFGLPWAPLDGGQLARARGERVDMSQAPTGALGDTLAAYAYAFEWNEYYAPRALQRLLSAGVKARVATRPFSMTTRSGSRDLGYGTIVVPMGIQAVPESRVREILNRATREDGIFVHVLTTGLTPEGIDLGSPSLRPLTAPRVLLVSGGGTSSYEVGEAWHLLDQRMQMPVTLVDADRLGGITLENYTHVVMVDGRYGSLGETATADLKRWIREGGILIATKDAVRWVKEAELAPVVLRESGNGNADSPPDDPHGNTGIYGEYEHDYARDLIAGTIFRGQLDLTHPLGFGYREASVPLFRDHRLVLEPTKDRYATPLRYAAKPLISGYASRENVEHLAGSAAAIAQRVGSGTVVLFSDNPNFRGVWYGTNKLFLNAVFFGDVVKRTGG